MNEFQYTVEQLRQVYDGDIDARNTFYFDNLDLITRMAYAFNHAHPHATVTAQDLIQGSYVDMDYFCYGVGKQVTNTATIIGFLHWSFYLAPYGGLAYCRGNNRKITDVYGNFTNEFMDNGFLRLDALIDDSKKSQTYHDIIADELEISPLDDTTDYTELYVEAFGKYLTPKQREVFALVMDGYGPTEIARKVGLTKGGINACRVRIRDCFAKHIGEVMTELASYGIQAEGIADRASKRFYKTDERLRKQKREINRRYRERKRGERAALSNGVNERGERSERNNGAKYLSLSTVVNNVVNKLHNCCDVATTFASEI